MQLIGTIEAAFDYGGPPYKDTLSLIVNVPILFIEKFFPSILIK